MYVIIKIYPYVLYIEHTYASSDKYQVSIQPKKFLNWRNCEKEILETFDYLMQKCILYWVKIRLVKTSSNGKEKFILTLFDTVKIDKT